MRLLIALAALVWLQPAARAPIVIGPQRDALTVEDLAAIGVVVGSGRSIWIVDTGPVGDTLTATVYLTPDQRSPVLRRGTWLSVTKGFAAPGRPPRSWIAADEQLRLRGEYAQVPIGGRDPDDVRDDLDEHRPFLVSSDVADEDVLAIVRLVRQQAEGDPILQIGIGAGSPWVPEGGVTLKSRKQPQCFRFLSLRRLRGGWVVLVGSTGMCP